jgi:hypothetical protein
MNRVRRQRGSGPPPARRLFILFLTLIGVSLRCPAGSVRNVDFREAPEMRDLAERARRTGDEVYPKILVLLADETTKSPRQFDIVFTRRLKSFAAGATQGSKISLNAAWLALHPEDLDQLLAHEMTHVAQKYRFAPFYRTRAPAWWEEGIASYVPYKVGFMEGSWCAQCTAEFPHYLSGYSCAGAFLFYVDKLYGSNVVRRLNSSLRRGSYSDALFADATGKSLQELWDGFKSTGAFTPLAALADIRREARAGAKENRAEALSIAPEEAGRPWRSPEWESPFFGAAARPAGR